MTDPDIRHSPGCWLAILAVIALWALIGLALVKLA